MSVLCLSRKIGQTIVIGDVVVEYAGKKGDKIRLRIAAAPDIKIRRGELPPIAAATHPEQSHE